MLRSFLLVLCAGLLTSTHAQPAKAGTPYGHNPAAGHFVHLEGVRLYYEQYGEGPPLVLLHGNGGNIAYMAPQIAYFAKSYRVIVLDCRGRGQSELGTDSLTYEQMATDVDALLGSLQIDSAYVIGRSDGGIIALLLGMRYPARVKKIAAFGANVQPDTNALFPGTFARIQADRRHAEAMLAARDTTADWYLMQQRNRLMEFQPHLTAADLATIHCPTLVLSCDRDEIREEHTLFIYRSIPRANLCIFTGQTHRITKEDPELFNSTVDAYFRQPYRGDEMREAR